MTAIVGPPRIGKSALLRRLCKSGLAKRSTSTLFGYAEASHGSSDVVLRALAECYRTWLVAAPALEQASMLRTVNLARGFVRNVASAITAIARALPAGAAPQAALAASIVDWLFEQHATLSQGGKLESLVLESVHERVQALAKVSGKRIVLALDALEQLSDSSPTWALVRDVLSNPERWPDSFHLTLAVRAEPGTGERLGDLQVYPGFSVYPLERFTLSGESEATALAQLVRSQVPSARSLTERELVSLIDGSPAVLDDWLYSPAGSAAELRRRASTAQSHHHLAFVRQVERLCAEDGSESKCLWTLLLLPCFNAAAEWDALRFSPLLESPRALDALRVLQVLDATELRFPSFGHVTRYEAARRHVLSSAALRPRLRGALIEVLHELLEDPGADASLDVRRLRCVAGLGAPCEGVLDDEGLAVLVAVSRAVTENRIVESTHAVARLCRIDVTAAPRRRIHAALLAECIHAARAACATELVAAWSECLCDRVLRGDRAEGEVALLARTLVSVSQYFAGRRRWVAREHGLDDLAHLALEHPSEATRRAYASALFAAAAVRWPDSAFVPEPRLYAERLRRFHRRHRDDPGVATALLSYWSFVAVEGARHREARTVEWGWRHLCHCVEHHGLPHDAAGILENAWSEITRQDGWPDRVAASAILERCARIARRRGFARVIAP